MRRFGQVARAAARLGSKPSVLAANGHSFAAVYPGARSIASGAKNVQADTWLATMFGGLYTRVARPQPDLQLHELALKANIPVNTVQMMWKRFVEIDVSRDTGDGITGDRRIALGELEPLLKDAGITDPLLRKALFDAFDADRCGTIDFREFVSGLALLTSDAKQDREVLIFCLFDLDGTRVITKKEMMDTFNMLISSNQRISHRMLTSDQPITAEERIKVLSETVTEQIFETCDLDSNGVLDLHEFRAWLRSDCTSAELVSTWFEDFSGSYTKTVAGGASVDAMAHANKEWLTSARARSWHDRAVDTGLYSRTDTVLSPGKCTSEPR